MLKYILLLVGIGLTAQISYAQKNVYETISGVVKTTDGHPAEFVSVSLKNTTYGSVTDGNGNFEFKAPVGEYIMQVYSIIAHKSEIPVIIKAGKNYFPDITIIEDKKILNEVVVTGQISPQSLQNSVYKVRVINQEKIKQKAAVNVESLLNTEVGIRLSNDMALGETDIELMGMKGNNVKVLIDGIPLIDRTNKKQSLTQIDINTIERIEIVEGPMSVMYGTDALAGVINVITKSGKGRDNTKLSVGARLQEESVGDEYDFMRQKGFHLQSANAQYNFDNGLYTSANFGHNEFGGWKGTKTGRGKESPSKDQVFVGGRVGLSKKDYNVFYKLDYLDENTLKKGDVPKNKKAFDEKFISHRYTHHLHGDWKTNNRLNLALEASHQNYKRDKEGTVINFATGEKTLSTAEGAQDETEYSMWFARPTATWKILHNLDILGGYEYEYNEGTGDKVKDGKTSITNQAIFVSAEYSPYEWLNIRPGVRSTHNSDFDAPLAIPSLNLKLELRGDMDLRLSYGKGYRAPTLQELYYDFYHENGGGFWIHGNPDLKAEKSDSYMASYVWRSLHDKNIRLTTTISGFYNAYKNRIQQVKNAEKLTELKYYNIEKYRTIGFSLENSFVWKQLTAALNISYIGRYNEYQDDEKFASTKQDKMRYSPEVSASVAYNWQKVATFNLFYKFTGKRYEYMEQDNKLILGGLESYDWADLTITRSIGKLLNVSGGVKNLFNITTVNRSVEGSNNGHENTAGAMMGYGRSYFVGLSFNFNK